MLNFKDFNILNLIDINFFYVKENFILKNLNLSFESGKITALLGVNGCGKSTLLKILSGVLNQNSGSITLNNEKITDLNVLNYKKCLGYMPEYLNLYQEFVLEDLLYFLYNLKNLKYNNVEYLLDVLNLNSYRRMKIKMLSKGTKQRINLAQSLLGNPKIVIFDEPSNGFDCLSIEIFYKLLNELKNLGSIVILTSHHLKEIYGKVDVLSFLSKGVITKVLNYKDVFLDKVFLEENIEISLKFKDKLSFFSKAKLIDISSEFYTLDDDLTIFIKLQKLMLFNLCIIIVEDKLCIRDIFVDNKSIEKLLLSYV